MVVRTFRESRNARLEALDMDMLSSTLTVTVLLQVGHDCPGLLSYEGEIRFQPAAANPRTRVDLDKLKGDITQRSHFMSPRLPGYDGLSFAQKLRY